MHIDPLNRIPGLRTSLYDIYHARLYAGPYDCFSNSITVMHYPSTADHKGALRIFALPSILNRPLWKLWGVNINYNDLPGVSFRSVLLYSLYLPVVWKSHLSWRVFNCLIDGNRFKLAPDPLKAQVWLVHEVSICTAKLSRNSTSTLNIPERGGSPCVTGVWAYSFALSMLHMQYSVRQFPVTDQFSHDPNFEHISSPTDTL